MLVKQCDIENDKNNGLYDTVEYLLNGVYRIYIVFVEDFVYSK